MASLGMDDNPFSGAANFKLTGPKMMRPNLSGGRLGSDLLEDKKGSCFEDADNDLDAAQGLCEVAAHQFLRDGDCRLEIGGTRKHFENCLEVAKKEVERLQAEEGQEQAREITVEQPKPVQAEKPVHVPLVADYMNEKVETQVEVPPVKHINLAGTGTIEIDDGGSDAESVHIDLSAIRRTRRV